MADAVATEVKEVKAEVKPEVKQGMDWWKTEAERIDGVLRTTQAELVKFREAEAARLAKENTGKEEQERAKLAEQGKYQEALKLAETKYQSELSGVLSSINTTFVPTIIQAAAGKVKNITPEALNDLPSLLGGKVRLDGKTFKPFIAGDDGKPLVDEKLNPVSIEGFVTNFVKSRPYMLADGMPKGTGLTAGAGAAGGKSYTVEAALKDAKLGAEWKKADPEGYKNAFQEYHASLLKPKAK